MTTKTQTFDATDPSDRQARIQAVAEECLRRRAAGEALRDEQVIAEHPALMPELGDELRRLERIQRAARRADQPASASTAASMGPLGTVAIEGYRILSVIQGGLQGVVYKAVQLAGKRPVALKVLREGVFASERARRRFEREVDLIANLSHPNIVTFHDSGVARGDYYFTMDYVRGGPLHEYVWEKELSVSTRPDSGASSSSRTARGSSITVSPPRGIGTSTSIRTRAPLTTRLSRATLFG